MVTLVNEIQYPFFFLKENSIGLIYISIKYKIIFKWKWVNKIYLPIYSYSRLTENAEITEARRDDWFKGGRENPQDTLWAYLLEPFA